MSGALHHSMPDQPPMVKHERGTEAVLRKATVLQERLDTLSGMILNIHERVVSKAPEESRGIEATEPAPDGIAFGSVSSIYHNINNKIGDVDAMIDRLTEISKVV